MITPTCVTALAIASHGVHSGALSARCTMDNSVLRLNAHQQTGNSTLLNRQQVELIHTHTDRETRI